jgi:hypothetical protein
MDPEACLQRAESAQQNDDHEEASDACADYRAWRRNGGFAAGNGDARVRAVEKYVSRKRNAS